MEVRREGVHPTATNFGNNIKNFQNGLGGLIKKARQEGETSRPDERGRGDKVIFINKIMVIKNAVKAVGKEHLIGSTPINIQNGVVNPFIKMVGKDPLR